MNETLDNIYAKCQQLSDEEFGVLLSAMLTEQKNRKDKEQREAWNCVWEAICYYTSRFGDICISNDRLGYHSLTLAADTGFQSPTAGEIEIT